MFLHCIEPQYFLLRTENIPKTPVLGLCFLPVVLPRQFVFITQQVKLSGLLAVPVGFADLKVHKGGLLDPMQQEAGEHSFYGLASVQSLNISLA